MIPYSEALDILAREALRGPRQWESVALDQSAGRLLAHDVRALWPHPRFDNAAMDGYSLRAELTQFGPVTLPISGCTAAGD